jgi:hypothetical protein
MYREFLVSFHKGLRRKDSPRIFQDGECSIAQDCYFDEKGNVFSRKFVQDVGLDSFDYQIKTIYPYIFGDQLVIADRNGSLYDEEGSSIGTGMGDKRLSCVEYDNVLYCAPALKRYDGTNLQDIGNTPPSAAPTVAIGGRAELWDCNGTWTATITPITDEEDEHDYAVNPDDSTDISSNKCTVGVPNASPATRKTITSVDISGYTQIGLWIKSSINVNAGDIDILLGDVATLVAPLEIINLPALSANTWTWVVLDIADPTDLTAIIAVGTAIAAAVANCTIHFDYIIAMTEGNLDGEYYYKYTYVDSNGVESMASPASTAVNPKDQKVDINVIASTDTKVSYINIYRTGGTLTDYYYVTQVANTTQTYTDNIADSDLTVLFDADSNDPPEAGLSLLAEHYERIIGAKDTVYKNSVYYSVQYYPEYFGDNLSQQYLISNKDECTGLLSWGRYVIYTKINKIFVLEGTDPSSWHERLSDSHYGNLSPHALTFYDMPIFLTYPGLFVFDGNRGREFSYIVRDFFKDNKDYLSSAISAIYDDKLFLTVDDAVLVHDFKTGVFYTYDLDLTEIRYNFLDDILYAGNSDNILIKLEQDSNPSNFDSVNFKIKSKAYALHDIPNKKGNLRNFIVNLHTFNQDITLNIYIDEELKQSLTLNTSEMTYVRRSFDAVLKGRYVEFEFVGTGLTSQIEIQPPLIINPKDDK